MQPTSNRQLKIEKAFTLIELLVVIAIVGILAGLAVVSMSGATEAARIAKIKVYSNSIRSSLMGNRVSEWRFDEGTGTTTADTVGTNTGTFISTPVRRSGADCVSGGCLELDGLDDYVNAGSAASLNVADAVTIEAWVKPSLGHTRIYSIATKGDALNLNEGYGFVINTNRAISWYEKGAGVGGSIIPDGVWSHVVAVRKGSEAKVWIYINGQIDSGFPKSVTSNDLTNALSLKIGTCRYDYHYFKGLIDEVRVYNAALTSSAIREDYLAGLDKLLANGQITNQDYQQRISELSSIYAASK
jgi:prepilin-type N-terminal cleavage/methylation domain-containing protein